MKKLKGNLPLTKTALEKCGITFRPHLITSPELAVIGQGLLNYCGMSFVDLNKDSGMSEMDLLLRYDARLDIDQNLKGTEWILTTPLKSWYSSGSGRS